MANMKEILPKGEYKVKVVGPSRAWSFKGDKGSDINMVTDSVQFEGHEQYWVDLNRAADKPAPVAGDSLTGTIEQDESGKYAPKFNKEKTGGGGGWRGGSAQATPGAIWSTAMQTATHIVAGYYAASGKKPKDINEFFGKIELVAPKVNEAVDKLVKSHAAAKPAETDTAASESGETPVAAAPVAAAPAPKADVVVEDITDEDLGEW